MSDEWNWNESKPSSEEDMISGEEAAVNQPMEPTAEQPMNQAAGQQELLEEQPMNQSAEHPWNQQTEQPLKQPGNQAETGRTEFSGHTEAAAQETYHWVNPEYQKRQQGTVDVENNTYEASSYRETVGSGEPSSSRETYKNGYYGGPYHGESQNSQYTSSAEQGGYGQKAYDWNQSPAGSPVTGQRKYGNGSYRTEQPRKAPREKKPMGTGKKFLVTAGMAVVFGVIAGGVMFGVNTLGRELTGQNSVPEKQVQIPMTETPEVKQPETTAAASADGGVYSVSEVASICMPSVVSITNASVKTVKDFFGGVQEYPIQSSGSGIIVGQNEKELLIATNSHVVSGAETLTVAFSDDAVYEAQIKGTAADSDLAVIAVKIESMSDETLNSIKVVTLGDSDTLQIGEQVVAIGNALGYGQSVTSGWVSAVNREMEDENGNSTGKLIQTDAAINPGNSGGALLNMRGELIGINSAKASATEVEGMGYAIPIATAQPILDELMNRETRYKVDTDKASYIGVTCMNVESSAAQLYGIPTGAFVDSVEEGGPAEKAGIQKGDIIIKLDGQTISGKEDLVGKLEYYEAGETVDVVISRAEAGEYKEQTVSVTLGRKSEMKQSVNR